ncbi:MAG: M56 family metallopeptidase [Streptosporangiaceae bacterium]
MTQALLVSLYALAVAWHAPKVLTRLTATGLSARLGIAAWLVAMLTALASAALALQFLVRAVVAGWPGLAEAVCRSVAGSDCTPVVYRSAMFEVLLGLTVIVATIMTAALAWRYGRGLQQAQRGTRTHAEVARMTARQLLGPSQAAARGAGHTLVLDAREPVAYCLPGRPATIVLTTGALAVLDSEQLAAVLAHERAHVAGRHHLLTMLTRGLAVIFPAVPLFSAGPGEIARLAEMCADDVAARRAGRRPLVTALLAMGTGAPVPLRALPATSHATMARVQRLVMPSRRARQAGCKLALLAVTLLLIAGPGLVITVATALVRA